MLNEVDDLPESIPFAPNAFVASLDRITDSALDRLQPLRERYPDAPIFVTSERIDGQSAVRALSAGITDLVAKPYHPHEVIMRAELTYGRSSSPQESPDAVRIGDLDVDLTRYVAIKNAVELSSRSSSCGCSPASCSTTGG